LSDTCERGGNGAGAQGTEAFLLDARTHNVIDANFLLVRIDIYVECRDMFVTKNETQDGAKRLTNTVDIYELFFKK
jgi:hypothetical protein